MNAEYLLDTNILSALFADDESVQTQISQTSEILIPAIVFGELYYGARKSGRVEANLLRVDELAHSSSILDCDVETAQHYANSKTICDLSASRFPKTIFGLQHWLYNTI